MAAATAAGLLLCFFISASAEGDCEIHKATGDDVTLPLYKYMLKSGQIMQWRHNSKNYAEVKDGKERCCQGSSKQIQADGSLRLTNLTKAKGGLYEPKVFNEGKPVDGLKNITLCVIDPVPKPIVNFTCSNTQAPVLNCIVQEKSNDNKYSYKWFHNNQQVAKQTKATYFIKTLEGAFRCGVYNQVSEQRSDVVSSPCADSGFVFPDELFGISIWVFVGAGGGIVVLLIVTILCCCIRNSRRKRMHIKDAEEYRLRFTPANQQQQQQQHHQHHHHHHLNNQQHRQPPGHTGPRHHRPKGQNAGKGPEPPGGQPRPGPRRAAQGPRPAIKEDDPPPLPQPRKKVQGHRA